MAVSDLVLTQSYPSRWQIGPWKNGAGHKVFGIRGGGSTTDFTALNSLFTVDYDGNVGIGTTSPESILELSNNGKVFKTTKILKTNKFSKKFLEDCVIKLPKTNKIENKNFKLQYGCISKNGKLVCGKKYK